MKYLTLIAVAFLATGCYSKSLMLQADAVSMTTSPQPGKKLVKGSEVEEKWCMGDTPVKSESDNLYGLADQVIFKAQDGGRKADFITDVRIYKDSDGCAILNGNLAKLQ